MWVALVAKATQLRNDFHRSSFHFEQANYSKSRVQQVPGKIFDKLVAHPGGSINSPSRFATETA